MNNRLSSILLLILIIMGAYWLWKQPSTHGDMERLKESAADIGDKTIDAAAKVTNRIADADIGEKTREAVEDTKDALRDAKDATVEKAHEVKEDFNDARERDRARN